MSNAPVKQKRQTGGLVHKPARTIRQAWRDTWRNTLMMLCDKFPLLAGVLLVYASDAFRRAVSHSIDGTTALWLTPVLLVAETTLLVGLVAPKALLLVDEIVHGIGGIFESIAIAAHRIWRVLRTGKRMT